jgi:hypothetical protein
MRFSPTIFTISALYAASAVALQNIYIGVKQENCGSGSVKGGRYDLWFIDSDVCNDGVITGYPVSPLPYAPIPTLFLAIPA